MEQKEAIASQLASLTAEIEKLKLAQESDRLKLQELKLGEHQRQTYQQEFSWQKNQYQTLIQDCDRTLSSNSPA